MQITSNSTRSVVQNAWNGSDDHRIRVMQVLGSTQLLLKCRRALRRSRRNGAVLRLPVTGTIRDNTDLTVSLLVAALTRDAEGFLRYLGTLEHGLDEWIHSAKTRH